MSGRDIFVIIMLLATILLWVLRFKKTKSYQIYAFNQMRNSYLVMFLIVTIIFTFYLNFLYSLNTGTNDQMSKMVITDQQGEQYKPTDRIDLSQPSKTTYTLTYTESIPYLYQDKNGATKDDNGQPYTEANGVPGTPNPETGEYIYIDPNGLYLDDNDQPYTKENGIPIDDFDKSGEYKLDPVSTNITVNIVDQDTYENSKPTKGDFKYNYNRYEPTFEVKYSEIYVSMDDDEIKNFKQMFKANGVKLESKVEVEGKDLAEVQSALLKHKIPTNIANIPIALFIASLFYHFIFFSKPVVKAYLDELYNINKFCGFLSYNMSYRANARVLIEDTLSSIDDGQFKDDFALIFFEKDRTMQERVADISNIYTFKFLEMFLGIASIVFVEGPSDSTTKSLQIIQGLGDEYFIQADLFFRTKEGSMSQLRMIIIIAGLIPAMVKVNIGAMFVTYVNTGVAFYVTAGFYFVIVLIFVLVNRMYMDNKIIRKEGRYV